jgi:hypothetical protein
MSSDTKMSDSDSSDPESSFDLDPVINASVRPGPEVSQQAVRMGSFGGERGARG